MQKIPTRLRGTNFCPSSARFVPSFVRQTNGPECTQVVRNARKHQFRVQWEDQVHSLRIITTRPHGTNFSTSSARFAPSLVRHPNGPECTQIVQNTQKRQFRVQWVRSGAFVAKNSNATSWHKLLHLFGPFCTDFVRQPNCSKCTKMVRNAPKHEFRVQWCGSGAFVEK